MGAVTMYAKYFYLIVFIFAGATSTFAGTVHEVQRMLNQLGYNAGPIDGAYGRKTKSARKVLRVNGERF